MANWTTINGKRYAVDTWTQVDAAIQAAQSLHPYDRYRYYMVQGVASGYRIYSDRSEHKAESLRAGGLAHKPTGYCWRPDSWRRN
jgi:hypothetical protein